MIVFDPDKDAANIAKHGVSLSRAGDMQMDEALVEVDDRFDYGSPDGSPMANWMSGCTFWRSLFEAETCGR